MHCKICGKNQDEKEGNFCWSCGATLRHSELKKKPVSISSLIIPTVIILFAFTILFLVMSKDKFQVVRNTSNETSSMSREETPIPSPIPISKTLFTITKLNLRKLPSPNSEVIITIPTNKPVGIFLENKQNSFYEAEYEGNRGYVLEKYLSEKQFSPSLYTSMFFSKVTLNMRSEPAGEVIETINEGDQIFTNSTEKTGEYVHAFYQESETYGWVQEKYLSTLYPFRSLEINSFDELIKLDYNYTKWSQVGVNRLKYNDVQNCILNIADGESGVLEGVPDLTIDDKNIKIAGRNVMEKTFKIKGKIVYWVVIIGDNGSYIDLVSTKSGSTQECINEAKILLNRIK